jgi:hypothetical protein
LLDVWTIAIVLPPERIFRGRIDLLFNSFARKATGHGADDCTHCCADGAGYSTTGCSSRGATSSSANSRTDGMRARFAGDGIGIGIV